MKTEKSITDMRNDPGFCIDRHPNGEIKTPHDWIGYPGYYDAVCRLQAEQYIRSCHLIALLPWWRRIGRIWNRPELTPDYFGAKSFRARNPSDYLVIEILWAHRLAWGTDF